MKDKLEMTATILTIIGGVLGIFSFGSQYLKGTSNAVLWSAGAALLGLFFSITLAFWLQSRRQKKKQVDTEPEALPQELPSQAYQPATPRPEPAKEAVAVASSPKQELGFFQKLYYQALKVGAAMFGGVAALIFLVDLVANDGSEFGFIFGGICAFIAYGLWRSARKPKFSWSGGLAWTVFGLTTLAVVGGGYAIWKYELSFQKPHSTLRFGVLPVSSSGTGGCANLSGQWRGSDGSAYTLLQRGNVVTMRGILTGAQITGVGQIQGNMLVIPSYQIIYGYNRQMGQGRLQILSCRSMNGSFYNLTLRRNYFVQFSR